MQFMGNGEAKQCKAKQCVRAGLLRGRWKLLVVVVWWLVIELRSDYFYRAPEGGSPIRPSTHLLLRFSKY